MMNQAFSYAGFVLETVRDTILAPAHDVAERWFEPPAAVLARAAASRS